MLLIYLKGVSIIASPSSSSSAQRSGQTQIMLRTLRASCTILEHTQRTYLFGLTFHFGLVRQRLALTGALQEQQGQQREPKHWNVIHCRRRLRPLLDHDDERSCIDLLGYLIRYARVECVICLFLCEEERRRCVQCVCVYVFWCGWNMCAVWWWSSRAFHERYSQTQSIEHSWSRTSLLVNGTLCSRHQHTSWARFCMCRSVTKIRISLCSSPRARRAAVFTAEGKRNCMQSSWICPERTHARSALSMRKAYSKQTKIGLYARRADTVH